MHGASTVCGACNCTFASKEGSGCDTAVCRSEANCGVPEACCEEKTNSGNGKDSCGPDASAGVPRSCPSADAAQASDAIATTLSARSKIRQAPAARPVPSSPKVNRRFSAAKSSAPTARTNCTNPPTAPTRQLLQPANQFDSKSRAAVTRRRQKRKPRPPRRSTAIPVSNPLNSAKNEKYPQDSRAGERGSSKGRHNRRKFGSDTGSRTRILALRGPRPNL